MANFMINQQLIHHLPVSFHLILLKSHFKREKKIIRLLRCQRLLFLSLSHTILQQWNNKARVKLFR